MDSAIDCSCFYPGIWNQISPKVMLSCYTISFVCRLPLQKDARRRWTTRTLTVLSGGSIAIWSILQFWKWTKINNTSKPSLRGKDTFKQVASQKSCPVLEGLNPKQSWKWKISCQSLSCMLSLPFLGYCLPCGRQNSIVYSYT